MRKIHIVLFAVLVIVAIFPSICLAQESQGGIPWSLSRESGLNDILPTIYFAPPSANEIREVIDYNNNSSECNNSQSAQTRI